MQLSWYVSRSFLKQRWLLWALFISNFIGTIYGYYWYKQQLIQTWETKPHWLITFVPDSPTASLFFTLALLFLLFPPKRNSGILHIVRVIIEALAVVTSVKYGVWACAMIIAGTVQGEPLIWQDWMLMASHTAMAVEALLYVRLFRFGAVSLIIAGMYTWLNDVLDYTYDIYPWLPRTLWDDITAVAWFTFILTGISILAGFLAWRQREKQKLREGYYK
ncbi:DUF1405 domain-containing protein [Paenibacillus marinisediminis]